MKQAFLCLLFLGLLRAQDQGNLPRFDAASIKSAQPGSSDAGYSHRITPTGIAMLGVSMGYCIRLAFGISSLTPSDLSGPAWLDPPTDLLYSVMGKCDSPASPEQIKLMLQRLLKDQVGLAIHRESRDVPAYSLMLAGGPKNVTVADERRETKVKIGSNPHHFIFQSVSMAQLALQLGPPMTSRPIGDFTGLSGKFDFELDLNRYLVDPASEKIIAGPDGKIDEEVAVMRALRDQLGMVLKPSRMPRPVWVVDHINKQPKGDF